METKNWRKDLADARRKAQDEQYLTLHAAMVAKIAASGRERIEHELNDKLVTPRDGAYASSKADSSGTRYLPGSVLKVVYVRPDGAAILASNHGPMIAQLSDLIEIAEVA